MDGRCSSLDATEIHFVIDAITAACVPESSDVSMQAWLMNQRMQDVLLNGVSVENASLDELVPQELLQRLVDAANISLGRMSKGFSAAIKSLNSVQGLAEEKHAPEEGREPTENQSYDEAQTVSEARRRCPAQEKLEKEIADYDAEIEHHSRMSAAEHASKVVELKKLRAASEDKLKKLRAGYKAYQRWREANKKRNALTRGVGRPFLAPLEPGKHHKCGHCGKQFKTGINLRMHRRRRHGGRLGRSFACDECEIFTRRDHLARHMLTHSGVKPFECTVCHKSFTRKDHLRTHEKAHLQKSGKHHKCRMCGKRFDLGIQLRMHERRRHRSNNESSFSCKECNMTFTKRGHLSRHELSHNGVKPFECENCHKSFSRKDKLRVHELVHSKERPYTCAECGYRYATLITLEKHQRLHRAAHCD